MDIQNKNENYRARKQSAVVGLLDLSEEAKVLNTEIVTAPLKKNTIVTNVYAVLKDVPTQFAGSIALAVEVNGKSGAATLDANARYMEITGMDSLVIEPNSTIKVTVTDNTIDTAFGYVGIVANFTELDDISGDFIAYTLTE